MNPNVRRALAFLVPPLAMFVVFVLMWHAAVIAFEWKPFLVPSPAHVAKTFIEKRETLAKAAGLTAAGAACGFASSFIVGLIIALVFSQSAAVRRALYPYAIFLQTVPIVAIAPLIVLWSGAGFRSVVIVSFIIGLFPIITNATAGLTSVDRSLVELFEVNNATRWQILFRLRLPNAIPNLVTGAKISSGLSVIGTVIGEFVAGYGTQNFGLGYLIVMTSGQLRTPELFAAVFTSTLLGLAIFATVAFVGDLIVARWSDRR